MSGADDNRHSFLNFTAEKGVLEGDALAQSG